MPVGARPGRAKRLRARGGAARRRCRPVLPKNAELILKETWEVDAHDVPLPCLAILANRRGYEYLARFFQWMAGRTDVWPDNHEHSNSSPWDEVFDPQLSDQVTFRLVKFDLRRRAAVLEYNGVRPDTARRGDALERYRRRIREIRTKIPLSRTTGCSGA